MYCTLICFDESFKLSYEAYNQYCLQVHIGAIKCLNFDDKLMYISETIECISNLCFSHCGIKLDALKHLTEYVTIMSKSQWTNLSHYVYKVIMGLMTHSVPAIHEQCVVLFRKCIELEDLDYILDVVMSEISWSLRIKYFMLIEIAPMYGIKKILCKYEELSISMWSSLNEPYLLSPCLGLYKVFVTNLSEEDFYTYIMKPILNPLFLKNMSALTKFNFVTYLLPELKFKHTKSLKLMYKILKESNEPDLYVQIAIIKIIQSENGLMRDEYNDTLIASLNSGNNNVRSEACAVLFNLKISPKVIDLLYQFITYNINSDCIALRIKLVTGFENILRINKKSCYLTTPFINHLHDFIIKNLKSDSNYQRKITSLKLYSIYLKYNKIEDYVSHDCRKLLLENLLQSDDIRKISSNLLISYFSITLEEKDFAKNWMKLGLKLCYDPLFYKNESGSSLIYTITSLVYKSGLKTSIFEINHRNVSAYLLKLAKEQENKLKTNFVDNVTKGTLYGLLSAIKQLSFGEKSLLMEKLNENEIELLLNLIECSLKLMLDTLASKVEGEEKTGAPSFAQMDIALSSLCQTSKENVQTPTNTFLLNFLWINIKICCEVASDYTVSLFYNDIYKSNKKDNVILRCANIIVDVLLRCRHKGVMEATCRSLGKLIKNWKESSNWCKHILNNELNNMKPDNEISRRSAGKRYLIQAIVVNNKEMIKYCVNQLFNIAKENILSDLYVHSVVDLPQAKALHLLTAIVSNSSITLEYLSPFIEELVFLCIDKLGSPFWTIRNAALQFFSSLQIKLIGQNRLNNTLWLSHLPLEPLLYQFPKIMHHLQQLWTQITNNSLSSQSLLIPYMSLLKGVKLQSWSLLSTAHKNFILNLRHNLTKIGLTLDIYTVRNMAAQAYTTTLQKNKLLSALDMVGSKIDHFYNINNSSILKDSNHIHGYISLYQYLKNVYSLEFRIKYEVVAISSYNDMQPLCKAIYISMNPDITGPFPHKSEIGYGQVINLMIENDIAQSNDNCKIIEKYLLFDEYISVKFLKSFLKIHSKYEESIVNKLIKYLNTKNNNIFRLIILNIDNLLKNNIKNIYKINVDKKYFNKIFEKCSSYSEKDFISMLPVLSCLCPEEKCQSLLTSVCKYINCDFFDSSDRFSCARSLYYFINLKNDVRLWKTIVVLLQDENPDIRIEATRFVNRLCYNLSSTLNPYFCLTKMFQISTVNLIMCPESAFLCFWNIMSVIERRTICNSTINPFFNEQSNFYKEQSNITTLAFEGLKQLIIFNNVNIFKEIVLDQLKILEQDCYEFKNVFIDENLMILDKFCYINLMQLLCKKKILKLLNLSDYIKIVSSVVDSLNYHIIL
ncbi:uncharacterized protein LOC126903844 isoform X2 [Daktulosphaira vitifoliae]|uniref:uncharacterized protein LOC126903844 isoform X2 n=1 Tax=Daktulosphaira vitifoliae TaxID=58002 RepID=UPI0021AA9335|nr:uncharacterized protein LOC126903844 isoform X2 [Daktulosphaira vitifoliae]